MRNDGRSSRASGCPFHLRCRQGCVGKTTTAGAIALGFADAATATHLISTDPAHSLGDLFEQTPLTQPVHSRCTPLLTIEELDGRAAALAWLERARPALLDLVAKGTYLDDADATSLLDLSLPGVDEIMGALRLAELVTSAAQRIVVDTAPTGHALRLLDAGTLIAGWTATLRAMADKAGVVASTLMRRSVRMQAEDLIDELEQRVGVFERSVLRAADFVIVTRTGEVVERESQRLIEELERRRLHIAARVLTAESHADGAAIAVTAAVCRQGRCRQVDVRGRVRCRTRGHAHGVAVQHGSRGLAVGSLRDCRHWRGRADHGQAACASTRRRSDLRVHARRLSPRCRQRVREHWSGCFARAGPARSRVVVSIAPPGLDEIMALLEIVDATESGDTLIIDSAPTGHFLRLLEMPDEALQWTHAIMRILVKYLRLQRLTLPPRAC